MTAKNAETIFSKKNSAAPLGIIALESAKDLGDKIDAHLLSWLGELDETPESFLIEANCPRFQSGDAKGIIKSTVRGNDLFILVDVGNYHCKYKLFGKENAMSPDYHFQDLKRIIQALCDEPPIIVAESIGELISLGLAGENPHIIGRLVVVNAPIFTETLPHWAMGILAQTPIEIIHAIDYLRLAYWFAPLVKEVMGTERRKEIGRAHV